MRANFFVMYPVAAAEGRAATYMQPHSARPSARGFDNALVREFPNITSVDMSAAPSTRCSACWTRSSARWSSCSASLLAAGLVVLFAAVTATREERAREFAIMRAVGARASLLRQVQRAELAGVGLLAGFLASAGGRGRGLGAGATTCSTFAWTASPLGAAGRVHWPAPCWRLLAGWWGLRDVLRRPVVETLRRAAE
jgi:putative ABC transport system permease protein